MMRQRILNPRLRAKYFRQFYDRPHRYGSAAIEIYVEKKTGGRATELWKEYHTGRKDMHQKSVEIAKAAHDGELDEEKCMQNLMSGQNLRWDSAMHVLQYVKRDFEKFYEDVEPSPAAITLYGKELCKVIAEFELLGDGIKSEGSGIRETSAARFFLGAAPFSVNPG
jgi:hypothetical protein